MSVSVSVWQYTVRVARLAAGGMVHLFIIMVVVMVMNRVFCDGHTVGRYLVLYASRSRAVFLSNPFCFIR